MEIDFWLERWNRGETGFHQQHVNPYLGYYYGELGPPPEKRAAPSSVSRNEKVED